MAGKKINFGTDELVQSSSYEGFELPEAYGGSQLSAYPMLVT